MKLTKIGFAALTAATIGALVVSGCSNDKDDSSSKSTTSAKAATTSASSETKDYTTLLIKASDIESPGDTFTMQTPTTNPGGQPGVAALFSNQGDTREIGDTILILPDEVSATKALEAANDALSTNVTGGTPESTPVGDGGTVVQGTSPDGAKAITVLIFTQGKAFVTLQFDSLPGDAVPIEGATEIGTKQAEAIKKGLG
jgi:hypothetical protein